MGCRNGGVCVGVLDVTGVGYRAVVYLWVGG